MPLNFPQVTVCPPLRYQRLTVFPLRFVNETSVSYALSDEAISGGSLHVTEVSEAGSVPELLVDNQGDLRVLFLEGEQLIGAKQNRVLNTTLLVAAHTRVKIPVSCVEQGRWRYKSASFGSSDFHSSSKLRHTLKSSVTMSLQSGSGHRSNQSEVWTDVADQQQELGVRSGTGAMSDTYEHYRDQISEYGDQMRYPAGTCGLAVAIGQRLVAVDLVDKTSTCEKLWQRMISGFALESLSARPDERIPDIHDVEQCIEQLRAANWKGVPPVGEGEEYRCQIDENSQASALMLDGSLVHASLVVAA